MEAKLTRRTRSMNTPQIKVQHAGCEGRAVGGAPFFDGMKTPSGERQARLKGMAASGHRGGARSSGGGRCGGKTEVWRRGTRPGGG